MATPSSLIINSAFVEPQQHWAENTDRTLRQEPKRRAAGYEIIDTRGRLDKILAKHTKQDLEKITHDTERDYFMSADEAKDYGIIDRVIEHH